MRKYNPSQWGGTETAVQRLFEGLRAHGVDPVIYCPRLPVEPERDPLQERGCQVKRFKACVPVWGISDEQKEQLISVGGNLMSFDALWSLLSEDDISIIHTHTGNRLGGIALTAAKIRHLPLVAHIHGGVLDLPAAAKEYLLKPLRGGVEWGKLFGWPLRSRKVLEEADAILTCNQKEADLLAEKYPRQRIVVQPHSVPADLYATDHRAEARAAFPEIQDRQILLMVGRIDPVKNQQWVIDQATNIFQKFPEALLVMAGACTDAAYGDQLKTAIQAAGLEARVLWVGCLPPGDPRLIGLFQEAAVVILPSLSETFGLIILEAWAAGAIVLSSGTSGAAQLIRHGENGWMFDLENPAGFHSALEDALTRPELKKQFAALGRRRVREEFDVAAVGGRVKKLYDELIEEKK